MDGAGDLVSHGFSRSRYSVISRARTSFTVDDHELVAGLGRAGEIPAPRRASEGPASLQSARPWSSTSARTRPHSVPATMMSPTRSVPLLDEDGRHRAAALVELRLDRRRPAASRIGVRLQLQDFGLQQATPSSSLSRLVPLQSPRPPPPACRRPSPPSLDVVLEELGA